MLERLIMTHLSVVAEGRTCAHMCTQPVSASQSSRCVVGCFTQWYVNPFITFCFWLLFSLSPLKWKLLQNERLYFFASEQMYKSSRGSNNYFPQCKRQGSAVKDRKGTSFGVLGAKSTRRTDKEAETKAKADIAVTWSYDSWQMPEGSRGRLHADQVEHRTKKECQRRKRGQ